MGLSVSSTGRASVDGGLRIRRRSPDDKVIALAGNPNVGKSTLFNALTGMNQHTGNWPGKTVASAQGYCETAGYGCVLVDVPGAYSLAAHSAEEEVARDFICFGGADATIIVCDATCLERNMNLVLQVLEAAGRAVVCVNLVDEAKKKGIEIDFERLSRRLGVQVVPTVARRKRTLRVLLDALGSVLDEGERRTRSVEYPDAVEREIGRILPAAKEWAEGKVPARWAALRLLEADEGMLRSMSQFVGKPLPDLDAPDVGTERMRDEIAAGIVREAERICKGVVRSESAGYSRRDRRVDRLVTGRFTAWLVMLALLAGVFWLTISGANVLSEALSSVLFRGQDWLTALFQRLNAPDWLHGALVLGVYRTLAWVISVMLPPMAIFFPLFTLLEDAGFLPRIAYNLDCPFRKCCACGKQALTMCMGFGCNAAGVVGCRIIDSPRERLIAMLTNSLVPCNGRFPMLIALITMFFALGTGGILDSLWSAVLLTATIVLGVSMTFAASKLLSATVLKGMPSSFALELPPYRKPQFGRVLIRSIFDRTLFVLGRAASVAAPAGLMIWLMANVSPGGVSLLARCAAALDPFARLLGLDGVILMAFVLGFPANEIVMPIALMAYLAQGTLVEPGGTEAIHRILVDNGWTWLTALCTMLFSLFHWPCSTTLMTVYRETGSRKWTLAAFVLPTAIGMALCFLTASAYRWFF